MGSNLEFLPYQISHFALGQSHTCVVTKSNFLKCWGDVKENVNITSDITSQQGVLKIVSGQGYSCILFKSGKLKCWGYNYDGRFGTSLVDNFSRTYSNAGYALFKDRIVDVSIDTNTCVLTDKNEALTTKIK